MADPGVAGRERGGAAQQALAFVVAASQPIEVGEVDVGGDECRIEPESGREVCGGALQVSFAGAKPAEVEPALRPVRVDLLRLAVLGERGLELGAGDGDKSQRPR